MLRLTIKLMLVGVLLFGGLGLLITRGAAVPNAPTDWQLVLGTFDDTYIMNLDGSAPQPLRHADEPLFSHACSLNGEYFAYSQANTVTVMQADGAPLYQAEIKGAAQLRDLNVSNDGQVMSLRVLGQPAVYWVVHAAGRPQAMQLGTINLPDDALEPPPLLLAQDGQRFYANVSFRDAANHYFGAIYSLAPDGSRLTELFKSATMPNLRQLPYPDTLSFRTIENERYVIYLLDARRGMTLPFIRREVRTSVSTWLPDGQRVILQNETMYGQSNLHLVDVRTLEYHLLTSEIDIDGRFSTCFLTARPATLVVQLPQ